MKLNSLILLIPIKNLYQDHQLYGLKEPKSSVLYVLKKFFLKLIFGIGNVMDISEFMISRIKKPEWSFILVNTKVKSKALNSTTQTTKQSLLNPDNRMRKIRLTLLC